MFADKDRERRRHRLIVFHGVDAADADGPDDATPGASLQVPPILVDEIAIAEWQRVVPTLAHNGRLTALQQTLLVGYCSTMAKAMRAEDIIAREGAYYEVAARGGGTLMKRHPAVVDAEKSWNALRQFARQLGIGAVRPRAPAATEQRRALFK
jgi:P27 family predicted phage terminase small subunit